MAHRLATDVGGTFSDLVWLNEETGEITLSKASSTPQNFVNGIAECVRKGKVILPDTNIFVHGSTVVINTLLEQTGANTGLITTKGFRDVYEIGRGNRVDMYDILYKKPVPLVPRELRLDVTERMDAAGRVVQPLDENEAEAVTAKLKDAGINSIAVCFLHSYANPGHETRMREIIKAVHPDAFVCLSHEVLRKYREYERTSTTCANAYVSPKVSTYIQNLQDYAEQGGFRGSLLVMQSSGGVMAAHVAKSKPINMVESGPAAGAVGCAGLGAVLGHDRLISFDMGGTTAKAALIEDGMPKIASEYYAGGTKGHPLMVETVDLIEVGAGGGSIAWVDAGGHLKVGPQSAGADPGPACYGKGNAATVTDADVLTGRIDPYYFLGGEIQLDISRSEAAIARLAEDLEETKSVTAMGIIRIVNANMLHAIRAITVERGHEPRDFVMVAFGGAGPTHALALARELEIPRVIIPALPGHFSAWGMLLSDLRHDHIQTHIRRLDKISADEVEDIFAELAGQGETELLMEGAHKAAISFKRFLDMRYYGQEHTVRVQMTNGHFGEEDKHPVRAAFDDLHAARHGVAYLEGPVEIVNLGVTSIGTVKRPGLQNLDPGERTPSQEAITGSRNVFFEENTGPVECPIYARDHLLAGNRVTGPAIIEEYASTTVLYEGDQMTVDKQGHLVINTGV